MQRKQAERVLSAQTQKASASIQERARQQINSYLAVIFGGRSEPRQIRSGAVFAGCIQATDPDDQIAQSGKVVGSMSGPDSGPVLTESDVTDVVDGIFDAPVTSARGLDLSRVHARGGTTGQEDFGFFGHAHASEMMSRAADHRRLGGVRKSRILWSDFEGVDFTSFMPTVALVQSDVWRGKKRPWGLGRAGRVVRIVWADWL